MRINGPIMVIRERAVMGSVKNPKITHTPKNTPATGRTPWRRISDKKSAGIKAKKMGMTIPPKNNRMEYKNSLSTFKPDILRYNLSPHIDLFYHNSHDSSIRALFRQTKINFASFCSRSSFLLFGDHSLLIVIYIVKDLCHLCSR